MEGDAVVAHDGEAVYCCFPAVNGSRPAIADVPKSQILKLDGDFIGSERAPLFY